MITIAIDGPVASGKSTTARLLARKLGYLYIDSGAMYRAVALQTLRSGVDLDDGDAVSEISAEIKFDFYEKYSEQRVLLNANDVTEAIRAPEVTHASSRIAALKGVRDVLISRQRDLGANGGVVMDGRDIGTVVFPNAELKVYLVARPEMRARRRYQELRTKGLDVDLRLTERQIRERDTFDSETQVSQSGAVQAPNAIVIDTTNLSIQEQVNTVLSLALDRGAYVPDFAQV